MLFRRRIPADDPPLQIHGDNGQGGGLHQGPQPVVGLLQGLRRLLACGDIPGDGGEELHLTGGAFMGNEYLGGGDFLPAAAPERGFPAPDFVVDGGLTAPFPNKVPGPFGMKVFNA